MTVNELIQELQKLPEELREQKLMVGEDQVQFKTYPNWHGSTTLHFYTGQQNLLAMRAEGLPQPQEQVKGNSRPFAFTEQNRNRPERVTGHGQYCACAMCFA